MPLIPTFGRQRQADVYELRAGLVYRVSSSTASATQRNCVSKTDRQRTEREREREKPKSILQCP